MTTQAGSGHLTSSLSAVELMSVLMFAGHFRYDIGYPANPHNDRLIFSKGHAAPLLYALWAAAGAIPKDELMTLRTFGSRLEGHPTMRFPHTEVPTGSLGQGLGVGVGMALNAKYLDKLPYRTYVLLGDGEMAEGSVWESMQVAAHYHLDNLVGIIDVNRLSQQTETMDGHNLDHYEDKVRAFGWFPLVIDGHDVEQVNGAYETAAKITDRPVMIIAKTYKGKGVSSLEDKEGKHAKVLTKDELEVALLELGEVDTSLVAPLAKPEGHESASHGLPDVSFEKVHYHPGDMVATREAYGYAIGELTQMNTQVIVLDGDLSNSTVAEVVKKQTPHQFFEMFIAEQNMLGVATGLALRGKIPFASSYAAFWTRAHDQIRMAGYANANLKVIGSHGGVSLGQDGFSQMGLEDIACMRSVPGCVVLYPSDGVSTAAFVAEMATYQGMVYLRTTRGKTPVLYTDSEFRIGGSRVHRLSDKPHTHVIVGAGITLHEALKAQTLLAAKDIVTVVVDLYSVKPLDTKTLRELTLDSQPVVVVEDHFPEGGIAEAVQSALADVDVRIISLAVRKIPQSGNPEKLLKFEEIDAEAIVAAVQDYRVILTTCHK